MGELVERLDAPLASGAERRYPAPMRFSQAFLPTVKEVPKDAVDASHVLLLRGGYIRMIGAGIYEMLPLGQRVLKKIIAILREELDAAGCQEVLMPAILPASYFQETGRWDVYGDVLMRLKDRKGGDYHLAPTHEEIITDMVRRDVRSYRQLPLNLFQIQMKYRDEPRPRAGLMRCREFLMKDAYSFDVDDAAARKSYATMRSAYERIFTRLGLDFRIVEADSGQIGGDTSAEFQILAQSGEDRIVACDACDYAANVEVAEARIPEAEPPKEADMKPRELVETPGTKTIEQVVAFFEKEGFGVEDVIKSLVYVAPKADGESEMVMALVRGDHEVNEVKLARLMGVDEVHLASDEDVGRLLRTKVGYVGPVKDALPEGVSIRVVADHAVGSILNGVAGATKTQYHFRHVNFGRDFDAELHHLRQVGDGDECPRCGGTLHAYRGIEGGHIFILGTHYSSKMNATFLDDDGEAKPFVMGCYGIGVTRLMAAAIEQHHDDDGIQWPLSIAPYQVIVLPLGNDEQVAAKAEAIYEGLKAKGVEVLLDDRAERPGVKFKDADLVGIPLRVTIGNRGLKNGVAELKMRTGADAEDVPMDEIVEVVAKRVRGE
ncbi:MAG TPA: proline--tRNA ligase [Polyangiaceae bacterium LLY-WYZ-15_(1-7)]|nr:proline--tRNA ligase [Polyangiaceae bacterium LLY-WYZ-15_(1-7)]HJL12162.1 proline--tRNA ligase [Polyangiaceae bacterium LLY-WYZ-15_(1-7)]HJL26246.1 proline--tRNA ligase [Polyangiaceae bacterium LLY-WYZ-15_(1-7)]HJL34832.1 proline--tRNA ligase [Polyangiaceae bacterium LLY-WYZ-15_(1-7)]HJL47808.1 proline--tRNA ligase [Polyangiaceae bacterium LLY-WYZ-15_(1-7)]